MAPRKSAAGLDEGFQDFLLFMLGNADAGVGHVVAASSINAIGYYFGRLPFELDYLPVDEAHPGTTSDPYSFSKQITEQIADYFARTSGIACRCLRFGAGLESLDALREGFAQRLQQARQQVESLGRLSNEDGVREVDRLCHHFDEDRRSGQRSPALTPEQRSLMGLRHNLFSFVELGEACRAMRLALTTPTSGSETVFVVDRRNGLGLGAELLARVMYPHVPIRQPLVEDQSIVSWTAATQFGFESQTPARLLLG